MLGDRRDQLLDRLQAAPRAWEQLVPGAEAGPHAVDLERQRLRQRLRAVTLAGALDGGGDLGAQRRLVVRRLGQLGVRERGDRRLQRLAVGRVLRRGDGLLEQHDAFRELAGEIVLAGVDLALHLVPPRGEQVVPGLDRELPAAGRGDRELALPAHAVDVRVDRVHRRLEPAPAAGRLVADDGAHDLVAVAEDVRGDLDGVADATLGRVASAVERRRWAVDLRAGRDVVAFRRGHLQPGSIHTSLRVTTSHGPPSFQRRAAPPHLASRRAAGTRGVRVRRLAGGGGAVVVADAAAGAAGPARLAVQVGVGVRGVAGAAGFAAGAGDAVGRARLPVAQRVLDRRLGAARLGRRPGALRP